MYPLLNLCAFYICITLVCSSNAADSIPFNDTPTDTHTIDRILFGKHWSLFNCTTITSEPGDYVLFSNGTVYLEAYNLTLNESHYILKDDVVFFCVPCFFNDENYENESTQYMNVTSYLTVIGLSISMVCLLIHLIIFSIVPDCRNMFSWSLAALCATLFCSYFFLLVTSTGEITHLPTFCTVVAFLCHLFLLASILWMTIMSYDVFLTLLRATGRFKIPWKHFSLRRFGCYCLCSFGLALLVAIAGVLADVLDAVPVYYRPEYKKLCWFSRKIPLLIFFVGPVMALTCLNFIFFILSVCIIHFNNMDKKQDEQQSVIKRKYIMYFKLSVIMGVTWIVGIVANIANTNWLWYIFVLLNTLQGLFIFIAFTFSKRVKKYFWDKISRGNSSEQTLPSTFQTSYSLYETSNGMDIDKVTDGAKEKTGTPINHV